jgi:hypothetical protein
MPGFAALAERALAFGLSATVLRAVEDAMLGTKVNLARAVDPAVAGIAARILKALIKVEDSSAPAFRVTALLGPTGVGKTTTLAKLAARAQRERGETVAIVTVDTYRVAAVEQLRAYADMLAAPFEVAFTPLDLKRALRRWSRWCCARRRENSPRGKSSRSKPAYTRRIFWMPRWARSCAGSNTAARSRRTARSPRCSRSSNCRSDATS